MTSVISTVQLSVQRGLMGVYSMMPKSRTCRRVALVAALAGYAFGLYQLYQGLTRIERSVGTINETSNELSEMVLAVKNQVMPDPA